MTKSAVFFPALGLRVFGFAPHRPYSALTIPRIPTANSSAKSGTTRRWKKEGGMTQKHDGLSSPRTSCPCIYIPPCTPRPPSLPPKTQKTKHRAKSGASAIFFLPILHAAGSPTTPKLQPKAWAEQDNNNQELADLQKGSPPSSTQPKNRLRCHPSSRGQSHTQPSPSPPPLSHSPDLSTRAGNGSRLPRTSGCRRKIPTRVALPRGTGASWHLSLIHI